MGKHNKITTAMAGAGLLVCTTVFAEEKVKTVDNVEIITVTVQKREQSIQDVPISISAFGDEAIEKLGANSFADLTVAIPNVSVQTGSGAFPVTYIRGIGTNDSSIGSDPSIGVYIDGVYASRLGGALTELLDVQRVEVLKGPQGTLFGRSSIGGAINIVTKKPTDELEGKVKFEYGSFDTIKTSGVLNVPLVDDTLFARGYVSKTTSDGWQENVLSGENGYQQDRLNAGIKLTWYLIDDVEVNLSSNWSDYDDTAGYVENLATPFPVSIETQILDDKKVVNGGFDVFGNPANNQSINVPKFERELQEYALDVSWSINDNMSFTSLSSYRDYTTISSREYDGTEHFIGENTHSEESNESFGQEFRLSSESDSLFWIFGVSAFKEKADLDFTLKTLDVGMLQGAPINFGAPYAERSLTAAETDSFALFGDANYKLTEKMSVTVGFRYSKDEKSMEYNNGLHADGAALLGGFGLVVPT
jgi:iron complex outermembrane receptor protein